MTMRSMRMTILFEHERPVAWTLSDHCVSAHVLGYRAPDLLPWELHEEDGSCRVSRNSRTAVCVDAETDVHVVGTVWVAVDSDELVLGVSTNYGHLAVDMVPYAEGGRLVGIHGLREVR